MISIGLHGRNELVWAHLLLPDVFSKLRFIL